MNFFQDINSYIEFLTSYVCLSGIALVILIISVWKILYNQNILHKEIEKINNILESMTKDENENIQGR